MSLLGVVSAKVRKNAAVAGESAERAIESAIDSAVEDGGLSSFDEVTFRAQLRNELTGFGALQVLLDDPSIEEVWINRPDQVFVARSGVSQLSDVSLAPGEIEGIVERMLRPTGRRLDRSSPFVDASLPDGSRLHVAIPDITRAHWSVNIRKFNQSVLRLHDLALMGTISFEQAEFLVEAIKAGKNILVSGGTQAGKTTMLGAILSEVAGLERIVSVEETFELRLVARDWVAMQTRQANLEGHGEVSLRRLIKEALRMRPGRIVVGEVREAECLDLLIALNSGLPGACTIHANSAADAITKMCTLPLLAGQNISSSFVVPTVGACIDYVVHCRLNSDGKRSVQEIARVDFRDGRLEVESI
jgi:pilus assembly protein CpaF